MTIVDINSHYDKTMYDHLVVEYYIRSDFHNCGYWFEDTANQREACENLMEKLLEFIPEKKGAILDVACGKGATTRYLLKYYVPSSICAINISHKQLKTTKVNAPGCTAVQMDATKLAFQDNTFDSMICVEAVFHFDTRGQFLQEAWRVLKPGGYLVLSDMLFHKWAEKWSAILNEKNNVRNLGEYRSILGRAGFRNVRVVDATNECWTGFYKHLSHWTVERLLSKQIDACIFITGLLRSLKAFANVRRYLLVSAKKV